MEYGIVRILAVIIVRKKRVLNIPAPTISHWVWVVFSGKGAPYYENQYKPNVKGRLQLNMGFGCRINYPTNTKQMERLFKELVMFRVEYVLSDYTVKVDDGLEPLCYLRE